MLILLVETQASPLGMSNLPLAFEWLSCKDATRTLCHAYSEHESQKGPYYLLAKRHRAVITDIE